MATRRIREFLDGNKVGYQVISHSPAYTAQEVAASAHVPGKDLAKVVVVILDGQTALAVIPATHEVDLERLCVAAGAAGVDIAAEREFAHRFEGCKLGTVPPFGNLFGMDTYADSALAKEEYIAFNAGTHTEVIAMKFADWRRLAHPKLAAISFAPNESRRAVCASLTGSSVCPRCEPVNVGCEPGSP